MANINQFSLAKSVKSWKTLIVKHHIITDMHSNSILEVTL